MRVDTTVRSGGIVLVVVLATALAGCSILGGGGCGPGDTPVDQLQQGDQTTITGEVTSVNTQSGGGAAFILDDGTGQAFVIAQGLSVSSGDCVTVTGYATPIPGGTEADIGFTVTSTPGS